MGKNEEIKQLVIQRGYAKRKLTLFKRFFDNFRIEQNPSVTQLRLRVEKLELVYQEFDNLQSELDRLDPKNENEYINDREEFESIYFEMLSEATDMVENLSASKASKSIVHNEKKFISKLPVMEVPEFHGNYDGWLSFRDSFIAIISNNDMLSNVQKFYYLKSALKGNAGNVIDSLETTDSN